MPATIRYNGSVIASVEPGKTKILECAEGRMASNVAVDMPEGYVIPEGTVSITENGTHDVSNYANAEVAIPDPVLQEKTATENGEVTPDDGYDGLSKVTVDVPIPAGYIAPEGTLTITAAGTYDVSGYASVVVEM